MVEYLQKVGRPIPEHYAPPDIMHGCGEWIDAFHELSTDRQLTQFGAGPIPAGSIERHTVGWDEFEAMAFKKCIRAMDLAYLDAMAPAKDGEEKGGLPQPPDLKAEPKHGNRNRPSPRTDS